MAVAGELQERISRAGGLTPFLDPKPSFAYSFFDRIFPLASN
jgi:hypothetical protein